MNVKRIYAASLAVLFVLAVATQIHEAKATTPRNFTLYGSFTQGWGFTATNITTPGPTIIVEQGDTVNLTLVSQDGNTHLFFVGYTNATSPVSGDPQSPSFSGTLNYTFVATTAIGTYTYRCAVHPTYMFGQFKVVATGTIPEFQPLIMLSLLIASTAVAVLAYGKKRRT